ncbi:MAG TPA: hypothetical protein VHP33_18015 [Polyangiaceae bacterium]|nr:hypothetical protein [Polyangiaceae bacterium]
MKADERLGHLRHLLYVLRDIEGQLAAATGLALLDGLDLGTGEDRQLAKALDGHLGGHFARAEVLAVLDTWATKTTDMRRNRKLESFVQLSLDLVNGRGSRMGRGSMSVQEAVQIARMWGSAARVATVETALERKSKSALDTKLAAVAYALAEGSPAGRREKAGQSERQKAYDGRPRGPMAEAIAAVLAENGIANQLTPPKQIKGRPRGWLARKSDISDDGNVSARRASSGSECPTPVSQGAKRRASAPRVSSKRK